MNNIKDFSFQCKTLPCGLILSMEIDGKCDHKEQVPNLQCKTCSVSKRVSKVNGIERKNLVLKHITHALAKQSSH